MPYGTYPRLIMAWMTTEAIRTQSPVLRLGRSLSEFMDDIGVKSSDSGGRWGVRTRFTDQLRRLMGCAIDLQFSDGPHEVGTTTLLVEERDLWWDPHQPKQGSLFDSSITLSKKFFAEILAHPVPFDVKILWAMKRSSLGLDLYLWLAYRTHHIRGSKKIPWPRLYEQFGPADDEPVARHAVLTFRRAVLPELEKLRVAWPELRYDVVRGALVIKPSVSGIPEPAA